MRAPVTGLRRPSRSQLVRYALRLALLCALVAGWVQLLSEPRLTTADRLLDDVRNGRTAAVSMERPAEAIDASGTLLVSWSTGLRHWWARYPIGPQKEDFAARLREAAAAAPRPVKVRTVPLGSTFRSHVSWGVLSLLLTLGLLIWGPAPTLVTRWGWFWLGITVPTTWFVFLLVEPSVRPGHRWPRRLTGGWALLLALALAAIARTLPDDFQAVLLGPRAAAG